MTMRVRDEGTCVRMTVGEVKRRPEPEHAKLGDHEERFLPANTLSEQPKADGPCERERISDKGRRLLYC